MEYCGQRGIPHSQFLKWDPDDQDKALAWMMEKEGRCSGCGTVRSDWLDSKGRTVDDPPWELVTEYCEGCHVLSVEREEFKDRGGEVHVHFRRKRPKGPRR